MEIGRSNLRKDVPEPPRLDPYETPNTLLAGPMGMGANLKLFMPKGMDLLRPDSSISHSHLRLEISGFYAAQMRRDSGYVVGILRVDSVNAISPLMVTDVVKIPIVYWAAIEQPKSRNYARAISFAPNAATAVRVSIVIGGPISAVVTNAASKYKTSQLIRWSRDSSPPQKTFVKNDRNHNLCH